MKILKTVGLYVFISLIQVEEISAKEYIEGTDAFCAPAKSEGTCERLTGCQPAYSGIKHTFVACVANPSLYPQEEHSDPDELEEEVPTIREALQFDCEGLDEMYLFVKTIVTEKKKETISKVKVCHNKSDGPSITIVVDCSSLQVHKKHPDGYDYLGSCRKR